MKNKLVVFALVISGLCSCKGNNGKPADESSATISGLGVNDTLVMKYVTCSKSMVDTLIAKGDSVFAQTDKYTLEDMYFTYEEYNKWLVASYGDTISAVVSIYETYDIMTDYSEDNETNAYFVWHEVAKRQIVCFLQKDGHEVTDEDINRVFHVIDGILGRYGCSSTTSHIIESVWCNILVSNYHLLDAYKHLMDSYTSDEIKKLVHEDYKFLLDTCLKYKKYCYDRDSGNEVRWEMGYMFYCILDAKAASINRLMTDNASEQSVIENLCEHTCFEDGKSFKLTYDMLKNYTNVY